MLDIYGSLFFAAAPKIRESLPAVGEAHCPVVVIRLRGRGTLHSATIACCATTRTSARLTGGGCTSPAWAPRWRSSCGAPACSSMLGPDAVVAATDELYGACATAQQRGRTWLAAHADGSTPGPTAV